MSACTRRSSVMCRLASSELLLPFATAASSSLNCRAGQGGAGGGGVVT